MNLQYQRQLQVIDSQIKSFQNLLERLSSNSRDCDPRISAQEFSKAYTAVYEISTDKANFNHWNGELYKHYYTEIKNYLDKRVRPDLQSKSNELLLNELQKRWESHLIMVRWMSRLFQYIERFFIPRQQLQQLQHLGINLFSKFIIHPLFDRIIKIYLKELEDDRAEEIGSANYSAMKKIAEIFTVLAKQGELKFIEEFEKNIVTCSKNYYRNIYEGWLKSLSPSKYLESASKLLSAEKKRLNNLFPENKYRDTITRTILSLFDQEIIKSHKSILTANEGGHSDFVRLIEKDDITNLKKFYYLFGRLNDNFEGFYQQFSGLILEKAQQLVETKKTVGNDFRKRKKRSFELVESLIQFYNHYEEITSICFEKNNYFDRAFKRAMEKFLEIQPIQLISDLLVEFVDVLLNKNGFSGRRFATEEKEVLLYGAFKIFSCLHEKDRFLLSYGAALVRRVINGAIRNIEYEKLAVEQIKNICGTTYTQKLEDKLLDIQIANSNNEDFESYVKKNLPLLSPEKIHVKVLSQLNWELSNAEEQITLPEEIQTLQSCYLKHLSGSKWFEKKELRWIHSASTIVTTTQFIGRKIDITVSVYQYMILNLFQKTDKLSFAEIVSGTQLDQQTVTKNLVPMIFCKDNKAIFNSDAAEGKFSTTDTIALNMKFNPKKNHYQVDPPAEKDIQAVDDEKIALKRESVVKSAISKIMKSRKILHFDSIVVETRNLIILFSPTNQMILKGVADLVDLQILAETEEGSNLYKYL